MNKSEINLRVAELLGFKPTSGTCCTLMDISDGAVSVMKDGKPYCLNYINDPVQREPLMIELVMAGWTPIFIGGYYLYQVPIIPYFKANFLNAETDSFGKATCLAYIEMMNKIKLN